MPVRRAPENPILTPTMVRASRDDFEVVGVFNPAAVAAPDGSGGVVLLLRVAEAPRAVEGGIAAPVYDAAGGRVEVRRWKRDTQGLDTTDSRIFTVAGETYLTSISHLRVARSHDGVHFDVEDRPVLAAGDRHEAFGVEDPRVTLVDGQYVLNYTAVSDVGIATALAVSGDLVAWERRGVVFAPANRDVTIFPERIGGLYAALHRPMPEIIGRPAIWYATSPDLVHWGNHRFVAGHRAGAWDDLKIGGGAVPFRVDRGWLAIYHGVTSQPLTYSLGAMLLDADDPSRVIARSRAPILAPEAPYEKRGFFGNVVFTCGAVRQGDVVRVYYGAADGVTAVAELSLDEIMAGLEDGA